MRTYTDIEVRYAETDQMGVVHHAVYPIWFETARTDYSAKLGMTYHKMEEMGVMLPVVQLELHYRGFARYGEIVRVETRAVRLTPARVVFCYRIFGADGEKVITTGKSVHAWVGKDLRPMNLRKHYPEIYRLMEEALDAEEENQ
jgi:acyl-CoA thioester hydrolase